MKFRKLRIAFPIAISMLCVGLILLWVRSFTIRHTVWWPGTNRGAEISSHSGHLVLIMDRWKEGDGFPPFATFHEEIDPNRTLTFTDNVLGFLYRPQPTLVRVDIPFWFLLLMGIASVALAWPKGKLQFTVRTLLIAMTLVGVALGVAIYAVK